MFPGTLQKWLVLMFVLFVHAQGGEVDQTTTKASSYHHNFRGYKCQIDKHKYYVLVMLESKNGERHYCGGTLISESHILTSASCCVDFKDGYVLTLPTLQGTNWKSKENITIAAVMPHRNFVNNTKDYDYALLGLATTLKNPQNYTYATLANKAFMKMMFKGENQHVQVMGFEGDLPMVEPRNPLIEFHCHSLKISSSTECLQDAEYERQSRIFCSYASPQRPETANFGELGGPVVYDKTLVGVISDVIPGEATLFARVDAVADWINNHGVVTLRGGAISKHSIGVGTLLVSVLISWYT